MKRFQYKGHSSVRRLVSVAMLLLLSANLYAGQPPGGQKEGRSPAGKAAQKAGSPPVGKPTPKAGDTPDGKAAANANDPPAEKAPPKAGDPPPAGNPAPPGDPTPPAMPPLDDASSIEMLLTTALNNPAIKITVRAISNKKIVAVLSGQLASKEAIAHAFTQAQSLKTTAGLDTLILFNSMEVAAAVPVLEPTVSYLWQFGYLQGDTEFDGKISLQNLADALNNVFPGTTPLATLRDTNMWLHGEQSRVQKARALLAMVDAPAPQVRLEIWAIQYAGSQASVGKRMVDLNKEIGRAQKAADMAKQALAYAIHKNAALIEKDPSFVAMREVGFDVDPAASHSLIESLLCLGLSEPRAAILLDARNALKDMLKDDKSWLTKNLQKDTDYFPNLTRLLAQTGGTPTYNTIGADQAAILRFTTSLKQYIAYIDALGIYGPSQGDDPEQFLKDYPSAPETLARESLVLNRQLEHLVEAFSADMQQMFFAPLLRQAQQWSYGGQGGVGLAGKTNVVVTSRLHADVVPQLETYGEKQVPRRLNDDTLSRLLYPGAGNPGRTDSPAAEPGKETSGGTRPTGGGTGVAGSLGGAAAGASPLSKMLIEALQQPVSDNSFYKIAPGIAIHVTPAMTPDGITADLKLDATFGVDTNIQKDSHSDTLAFRPPDAVKEHHVVTTANVGGFNLFEVSSFNMDTLYPRPPFVLPILGNIPLVGSMFRFSRGTNRTYHQSVILVNATLVPRGLGLVGFYGSNFAGRSVLTRAPKERSVNGKINYNTFIGVKQPQ